MFAKIVRWRLTPEIQGEQAFDQFIRDLSRRNTPILRDHGLLDGFVVRIAPDMMLSMNLYDSDADAESAWRDVIANLGNELDGKLEFLERYVGPAVDMPMLLDEA
ncbi:MAG TPA: hypothetical protein VHR64_02495 [Thermomicrobiales bacterium]|nr:hypothetical protein [Thermomicrobiales bacterium]